MLISIAFLLLMFLIFRVSLPFVLLALLFAVNLTLAGPTLNPSLFLAISLILMLVIGGYYLASYLIDEFVTDGNSKYQGLAYPLFLLFAYQLFDSDFFITAYSFIYQFAPVGSEGVASYNFVEMLRTFIVSNLYSFQAIVWAVALVMLFIVVLELVSQWILKNYQIKCSLSQFRLVIFLVFLLNFSEQVISV